MKITQRYFFDNFAKITVDAGMDIVNWKYKSLVYEASLQFRYTDPDIQIYQVMSAVPGVARASYIALLLFIVTFGFRSMWGKSELGGQFWVGVLVVFFIATIGLFFYQFFKKEFVRISNSKGSPLLWACSSKNPELVDFILAKIKEAKASDSPQEP